MSHGRLALVSMVGVGVALAHGALAAGSASSPEDETSSPSWIDGIVFSGRIEAGASMNPASPDNGINFGRLFTDKANQIVLNQFALSMERAPDPSATALDLGFKVEGMYGMDSQFTHFLGLGDQGSTNRNSFDLVEADLKAHLPIVTARGIDAKVGLFPSPMGAETIDPTGNIFYSRSYIFDFGLPKKHAGVLTTARLDRGLSLYLGYTTGVNTSLGPGGGYNDTQPHLIGGFGLDFGRLTLKALAHVGPEDPPSLLPTGVNAHDQWRYIGDVVLTWKVNDRLTSITEVNYVRDNGLKARAGGAAEYLTFALSPTVGAAIRAEVWRDAQGVFVVGYPGNLDYLNAEEGRPSGAYRGGAATYGEVTAGLNIKADSLLRLAHAPADSPFAAVTFRPEVRYDRILAGGAPFGGRLGGSKDEVTVALDVVIPLSFQRGPPRADGDRFVSSVATEKSVGPVGAAPSDRPIATAGESVADADIRPLARSLVTAQTLAQRGAIGSLESLNGWAPGLTIARSGTGPGALTMSIRGLGDAAPPAGMVPAVGLRVDGVVLDADLARTVDLFDVAAVEIERGPGGAAYGDASLGGMLGIERPRPTRRWGAVFDYSFEQGYHANVEKGLFNAPVGAGAGLSLFVSHSQRGGYLTNIFTGDPLFGRDELTTGNLQFDWSITPRLDVTLGVTLAHQDGQGVPLTLGDTLDARLSGPSLAKATPGLAFSAYGTPYVPGVTAPLGPFQSANDFGDGSKRTAQIYSLTLAYELPAGRVVSTTAYQRQSDFTGQDLDGGCVSSEIGGALCPTTVNPFVGFLHAATAQTSDRISQDLSLAYAIGARATVLAGLSYSRDRLSAFRTTSSASSGALGAATLTDRIWGQTREARSVFAGVAVDLTSRLRLDGALRYLDERTDYQQQADQTDGSLTGFEDRQLTASAGSQQAARLLPRAAIDYSFTDQLQLYASYATGFRPGGQAAGATLSEQIPGQTNYDPANPRANDSVYAAETDATYEIGSKASGLGGQLSADVAAFITEDRGRQATQLVLTPGYGPAVNTYVVNLPKVEVKGVELHIDIRPRRLAGLTLTGEGAYQDARIVDGRIPGAETAVNAAATAGAAGSVFDLTGSPVLMSPALTYAVRADYRRPLGPGVVNANIAYRWTDRYALASLAGQGDFQPAYGLLDVSLSYSRSFYRISASVRNLLDQAYLTSALPALFVHSRGDPRTAVMELQARF
jgi:outer membrane receptor protein involved in Fe transport